MFRDLIGNGELKSRLQSLAGAGTIAHAVLLVGEAGCGRRAFARALAAEYLGDPSGLVDRGVHPDLISINGAGASGQIPVKAVREALSELARSPVITGGRRAVLIPEAEALNQSSASALLKTLEEPPEGVLFVLACTDEGAVLPTVRSRCGVYHILPAGPADCAELCAKRTGCPPGRARELSELFSGRVGLVLHYLRDPGAAKSLENAREFCRSLEQKQLPGMLMAASRPTDRAGAAAFWAEVSLELAVRARKGSQLCATALQQVEPGRAKLENNPNLRLFATRLCLAAAGVPTENI